MLIDQMNCHHSDFSCFWFKQPLVDSEETIIPDLFFSGVFISYYNVLILTDRLVLFSF